MRTKKNLILFDVDGTLIPTLPAHIASFSAGFKEAYDVNASIDAINHVGMTDWQIIVEVMKMNGLDESQIDTKLRKCMQTMADYFKGAVGAAKIEPLPGGGKTLANLFGNKDNLLGIVIGNLEPIAQTKLKAADIGQYFKTGGYGSDDPNRANLIKRAIEKTGHATDYHNDNIYLVGDTPRDIQAGKEARVKTIGVATGKYTKEQLKDSGADFVVDSLPEILAILK